MAVVKRTFVRNNTDGTKQTVTLSWDAKNPTASFQTEADGYSGSSCLSELSNIEKVIGSASVNMKPEAYNDEDTRDVFIVGMN